MAPAVSASGLAAAARHGDRHLRAAGDPRAGLLVRLDHAAAGDRAAPGLLHLRGAAGLLELLGRGRLLEALHLRDDAHAGGRALVLVLLAVVDVRAGAVHDLAVARHHVVRIRVDRVLPDAAVDRVDLAVACVDRVVAVREPAPVDPALAGGRVAVDPVAARPADDVVVVEAAVEVVVVGAAVELVLAVARLQVVVAAVAAQRAAGRGVEVADLDVVGPLAAGVAAGAV